MGVWRLAFFFSFFSFFFCTRLWDCGYCSCTVQWTVAAKFDFSIFFSQSVHIVHCSWTHKFHFSVTFSLKSGPTVLFTYLKIILLQYFLVFSFQLYPNGPLISPFVSVFIRMTDTWQVKDPRAKKTHFSFFLQHLFPWQF